MRRLFLRLFGYSKLTTTNSTILLTLRVQEFVEKNGQLKGIQTLKTPIGKEVWVK